MYYLLTVYDTRSGRAQHVFCRDTFRQTEFFFLNTTQQGFYFISSSMFVTPQCLIAVIWVTVAGHDTYQSLEALHQFTKYTTWLNSSLHWNKGTDYNKPSRRQWGEKIAVEKNIRKATWNNKILENKFK